MKSRFKYWLIAILSAVFLAAAIWVVVPTITASADEENVTCTTATGNYLNEDYLSVYKIPTSLMTYESVGGEGGSNPLSYAFDGNWNTFWQTGKENAGQGSANPSFLNAITVTFSQPVEIQSIVYASSSAREGHGYPTTLNIYTANGGDLSLYGSVVSTPTNDRVVFSFKEAVTVTQVKFEFRVVNPQHNWTATAKEIQFLQPDNPDANKVLDLFDDYAQLSVKDEYKSDLSRIRENVSSLVSYESALKPLLDRAEAVVNGQIKLDHRREFSTDENATNVITQYGNMRSYAGNTLRLSQFGINRQVTGVAGLTGDTITVYVEAEAGDPLPSIVCTQVYGDWRSWSRTFNLTRGKNVITVPNFITSNYSRAVTAGGPIHIVNAYEPSQQSPNVKVYIEGGYLYPVFRKGGDETSFRDELTSYYEKMNAEGLNDVVELVGDHFLHTASASRAYNDFITRKVSPQKNAEGWDNYIKSFLEFDGISFDPSDEHFNEKNLHLYTNFRKVQPWGGAGAFSAGDHIGFISFGEDGMTSFGTPGWGVAHEIGHALDCNRREIAETTNNMWSKFELAYISKSVSRNQNAWVTNNLTPDETAVDFGLFNKNRECYQIWWNIETYFPGYWGRLDNNYRYYDETAALTAAGVVQAQDGALTGDERMVYFSSLATGVDLGYYFERCGFSFSSTGAFKLEETTGAYKKLVAKAIADGVIKEKGLKLWYLDANQYFFDMTSEGCYNQSTSVEIREIWKTSTGYTLLLPESSDAEHLGYEIMEYRSGNWHVIGFTYSASFTDSNAYEEGYVPRYKIRAYDRLLNCTGESPELAYTEFSQTDVCRIGTTYYNSLSDAIAAATAGDTIYICADLYTEALTINKNLTILPDPDLNKESVVITKRGIGVMFTVSNNVTLNLGTADGAKIVLDGNSFTQNGALIKVDGGGARLNVYNAELRNNYNTDHGGAVFNTGGSTFTNVIFKGNKTSINGGAIANFSGGVITLTGCTFTGNSASAFGGALTLDGKTTLINVTIKDNKAATRGGAIYMACGNSARAVSIEGGEISGNTADLGSAIYLENGSLTIGGGQSPVQLSGQIFKSEGTLYISTALPDFTNVTFRTATLTEGKVLLTASGNLTFTEADAESVNIDLAVAYLGEGNKTIMVKPNTATVTIVVNGTTVSEQEVVLGDFVLPDTVEGLAEDKYLAVWTANGNSYSAGDTVKITGNCTFTAEIGNKVTVTLEYDDENTESYLVIPNEKFYLPVSGGDEKYLILGWTIGDEWYAPAEGVTITENTVIVADVVIQYKVTITINGEDDKTEAWHSFSDSLVLQECAAPEGKEFSHWMVNGVVYNAGDTVHITEDTVITAMFKAQSSSGNDDENGDNPTPPSVGGNDDTQTPPSGDDNSASGDDMLNTPSGDNSENPSTVVGVLIVIAALVVAVGISAAVVLVKKRKNAAKEDEE